MCQKRVHFLHVYKDHLDGLTRRASIYGAVVKIGGIKLLIRRQALHSNHFKLCLASTPKIKQKTPRDVKPLSRHQVLGQRVSLHKLIINNYRKNITIATCKSFTEILKKVAG